MSAVTSRFGKGQIEGQVIKVTNASAAATLLTLTTTANNKRLMRLAGVFVKYSANATVDVDVTLNAVEGAAYDTRVVRMSLAGQQHAVYIPEQPVYITPGDTIDVACPSGGGATTSQVRIVTVEV